MSELQAGMQIELDDNMGTIQNRPEIGRGRPGDMSIWWTISETRWH